jgi:hypothetical protein
VLDALLNHTSPFILAQVIRILESGIHIYMVVLVRLSDMIDQHEQTGA